ncbi:MAG: 3-deoxy-7-phosphoheptulonate synthase [Anaerovoracaceae bacterium]|jgi:3-deoxy-7-phosphoheptulonate synthase
MITVLKEGVTTEQKDQLKKWFMDQGFRVDESKGDDLTFLGLIGDTSRIDRDMVEALDIVERVVPVSEPFKMANRKFHPMDTVVEAGGAVIGGGHFAVIAGPCSVESEEQIVGVAERVKAAGATILRGGAFKPRTSPYSFQGLKADGLKLLSEAKKVTGLPIVTEIMDINHLPLYDDVDIIQVGARNMQNFELLKELGHCGKPILLKRGLANTIQELLMSAEYIMAGGNDEIILCERGIRTFETATRNTMDLSAIPVLHQLTHLPVVADPSHATGHSDLVPPMALGAAACGADGLMIEVHNDPEKALCDGAQSLTPDQFDELMPKVKSVREGVLA